MAGAGWARGDLLGHDVPLDLETLAEGGAPYLTDALRATGALGERGRVAEITQLEPVSGGSTGRKARLGVTYEHADPGLPERLFVKLSRDLDDEVRDRGRRQMASEVRFGLLSQLPGLPVAVPRCLFGDHHVESGTGILVSERVAFGEGGIEPHRPKARDHELPDPLGHYEVLVSALGRLAGADRAGRFPAEVMAAFDRGAGKVSGRRPAPTTADDVRERVARFADFASRCPQLLPGPLRSDAFLAELVDQAPRSVEHGDALRAALRSGAEARTAFCHWNANIDNAWFWRDGEGALACGLLDWGNVGRIDLVTALSSALVFAEPSFLVEHLDHLLARFADEVEAAGGGRLDPTDLRARWDLQMVVGGLRWPLDTVPLLEHHVPDLATVTDRFDPRILDDELARTQLHLLTAYLTLWHHADPRAVIDDARRAG